MYFNVMLFLEIYKLYNYKLNSYEVENLEVSLFETTKIKLDNIVDEIIKSNVRKSSTFVWELEYVVSPLLMTKPNTEVSIFESFHRLDVISCIRFKSN